MTTTTFRQHDEVPSGVSSALYRQLLQEWVTLNANPTARVSLRRWARSQPVLAGLERPGDVVDAIDEADHGRTDELLGALLALLRDGHQLAGRVLLQAMLPKLLRLASSTNRRSAFPCLEDQRAAAVAEFWGVATTYPLERRPARIAANLAMDTLSRLHKGSAPLEDATETWKVAALIEEQEGTGTDDQKQSAVTGHLTSAEDLVQVVTWGVSHNAITAAEATLIGAVYGARSGSHGAYGYAAAAAALDITQEAARARCSRAVRKLTAAARDDLITGAPAPARAAA